MIKAAPVNHGLVNLTVVKLLAELCVSPLAGCTYSTVHMTNGPPTPTVLTGKQYSLSYAKASFFLKVCNGDDEKSQLDPTNSMVDS
ncbi:hypothetical protein QYF36_018839 [Acer negundo]|nr:hypothetical protein QYF36_018839 [Acer negundo]